MAEGLSRGKDPGTGNHFVVIVYTGTLMSHEATKVQIARRG